MPNKYTRAAIAALATCGFAAFGATGAYAKLTSQRVTFKELDGKLSGATTVNGKVTGSLGAGTYKETITNEKLLQDKTTLHLKKGTIRLKESGKLSGKTVHSVWTITGGTGAYKHITGGGTATGNITTDSYHYKGVVKY